MSLTLRALAKDLVAALFEQTANPGRASSRLNSDAHGALGIKALPEGLQSATQPTLLDDLAASGVQQAQMTVLVTKIQTSCHPLRFLATITHGPILLPFLRPFGARKYLQTLQ